MLLHDRTWVLPKAKIPGVDIANTNITTLSSLMMLLMIFSDVKGPFHHRPNLQCTESLSTITVSSIVIVLVETKMFDYSFSEAFSKVKKIIYWRNLLLWMNAATKKIFFLLQLCISTRHAWHPKSKNNFGTNVQARELTKESTCTSFS